MKKAFSLFLALALCLALSAPALASGWEADIQRVSGAVRSSELRPGAAVRLSGDTVLTLDADRSVQSIVTDMESYTYNSAGLRLTVAGDHTLRIECFFDGSFANSGYVKAGALVMESGSVECGGVFVDELTMNGGSLSCSDPDGPYGIWSERITVSGGEIWIDNNYPVSVIERGDSGFFGIWNMGDEGKTYMTVSGGAVDIRNSAVGISSPELEINGGSVSVEANSTGVSCEGAFALNGGKLSASGAVAGIAWSKMPRIGADMELTAPSGGLIPEEPVPPGDGWPSFFTVVSAGGVPAASVRFLPAIRVTLNGTPVAWTDARPFVDANSRTLVPLRAVGDAMGIRVIWDGQGREAIFTRNQKTIRFPIGSSTVYTTEGTLTMDTAAVIVGDRTYAPIRYLAEFFGYRVGWDGATRTVSLAN